MKGIALVKLWNDKVETAELLRLAYKAAHKYTLLLHEGFVGRKELDDLVDYVQQFAETKDE